MTRWKYMPFALPLSLAAWLSIAPAIPAQEAKKESPKGDAARGKKVFEDNCEECHDAYSKEVVVGPGLQGLKNGKLPSGKKATFEIILDTINTGPAEMTSFETRLTEQQKADVVTFAMTL